MDYKRYQESKEASGTQNDPPAANSGQSKRNAEQPFDPGLLSGQQTGGISIPENRNS